MTYPDSVRFLYALGNELKTAEFALERITRLAEAMGHPHLRPHLFIHVAGTNGKGSTCAMIESGLRAAGLRTGLFTSPHLLEPTERIRIDGIPVSIEEFTRAFDLSTPWPSASSTQAKSISTPATSKPFSRWPCSSFARKRST